MIRSSAVMRQATAVQPLGSFENSGSNKGTVEQGQPQGRPVDQPLIVLDALARRSSSVLRKALVSATSYSPLAYSGMAASRLCRVWPVYLATVDPVIAEDRSRRRSGSARRLRRGDDRPCILVSMAVKQRRRKRTTVTIVNRKEGRLGRAVLALNRRLLRQRFRLDLLLGRLLSRVAGRKRKNRRVSVLHRCEDECRERSVTRSQKTVNGQGQGMWRCRAVVRPGRAACKLRRPSQLARAGPFPRARVSIRRAGECATDGARLDARAGGRLSGSAPRTRLDRAIRHPPFRSATLPFVLECQQPFDCILQWPARASDGEQTRREARTYPPALHLAVGVREALADTLARVLLDDWEMAATGLRAAVDEQTAETGELKEGQK